MLRRHLWFSLKPRTLFTMASLLRFAPLMRLLILGMAILCSACAPQRPPVPPGEIPAPTTVAAADEQYGQEVLAQLIERYPLSRDDADIERVRVITDRLTTAANANGEPWHVYVLDGADTKNAAATRGNYIFVWTGMLRTVENDDELATVLAHEIGHVLAGHTAPDPSEEVSRMIAGVAGAVTGHTVSARGGGPLADLASALVQSAIEAVLVNPTSQSRELEADHIGLFLMADAGFDPATGIEFWRRATADPQLRGGPLQFLSSHPSSDDRLTRLEEYLGRATERYNASQNGKAPAPKPGRASPDPIPDTTSTERANEPIDWVVAGPIVPVYAKPDRRSDVVAELALGAAVRGPTVGERWVEISEPARGFIEKVDLDVVLPEDWTDSPDRTNEK